MSKNAMPTQEADFNERIVLMLDRQLNAEQEQQLLADLRHQPELMAKLNQEQAFREFLRAKVYGRAVSPAVLESLKAKLLR